MRILACLPENALAQLRRGMGPAHPIRHVATRSEIRSALASGEIDVFVVDPVVGREDFVEDVLRDAVGTRAAVVLYVSLTDAAAARRVLAAAAFGHTYVVLHGFHDAPEQLAWHIRRSFDFRATAGLLSRLAPRVRRLPERLQLELLGALCGGAIAQSVNELAGRSAMSRYTVERWMRRVGLVRPKVFLDGVKLARYRDYFTETLSHDRVPLARPEFESRRTASDRARSLLRTSLVHAVVAMPATDFVDRLAKALTLL